MLGILLGIVLPPIALGLAGVGVGRLLEADEPASDPLAVVLVAGGALLLAVIALLGVWSPALPIVGGLIAVVVGIAYLAVPGLVDDAVRGVTDGRVQTEPVDQLTAAATSGQLLVAGALLLAGGLAVAVARRKGRRFGERSAEVEHARAEVARAERSRRDGTPAR